MVIPLSKVLSSLCRAEQNCGEDRDEGEFRAEESGGELFDDLHRLQYPSKTKTPLLPRDKKGALTER